MEIILQFVNFLKELWIDGNRIKQIPDLIGNLKDLVHLEASVNHIDYISGSTFQTSIRTVNV